MIPAATVLLLLSWAQVWDTFHESNAELSRMLSIACAGCCTSFFWVVLRGGA